VQEEEISKAETVFRYIAETYVTKLTPPPVNQPKPPAKQPIRTPSFLASACSFQRPVATSTTSTSKQTPQEELKNELEQYLGFEAAPMEGVGELSAEEVLMNPLLWWKVSMSHTMPIL
jgi:hypothetical protein